jgi:hypothetical protein
VLLRAEAGAASQGRSPSFPGDDDDTVCEREVHDCRSPYRRPGIRHMLKARLPSSRLPLPPPSFVRRARLGGLEELERDVDVRHLCSPPGWLRLLAVFPQGPYAGVDASPGSVVPFVGVDVPIVAVRRLSRCARRDDGDVAVDVYD